MLYLDNKATPDNKATQVLVGFLRKTHLLIMEFERIPYSCILSNSMIMSVPFSKTPAELLIKNPKCGYQLQIGTDWNFENDLLAGFWENHISPWPQNHQIRSKGSTDLPIGSIRVMGMESRSGTLRNGSGTPDCILLCGFHTEESNFFVFMWKSVLPFQKTMPKDLGISDIDSRRPTNNTQRWLRA